jgi:predicted lipid carrier protein YhbT
MALGVNLVLRRELPRTLLEKLEGKRLAIEVKDLECTFCLQVVRGVFHPSRKSAAAAMRFRATAYDFAAIAAGEDDADALFFQRRLMVEGDTELALEAKNELEALDIPRLRKSLRAALQAMRPLFREPSASAGQERPRGA